jgi:hypothetical protein
MSEAKSSLDRRIPFWSSKSPEITTVFGKSKYHFSGFHSQRVLDGKIIMDDLSLLGQRLDGADIGPIIITLKEPLEASLQTDGAFNSRVSLILTSGSNSSTIDGEISGKLEAGSSAFAALCISAQSHLSVLSVSHGRVASHVQIGAA